MIFHGLQKTSLVDFPQTICATLFTKGCNMRCGYCHNPDLVLPQKKVPSISEEDIFSFLDNKKNVLEGICITGGEPTLHRDLYNFCVKVKKRGLKIKLDTNGTNPQIVQKLIDEKLVDYIAMDIKAPKEKYSLVSKLHPSLVEKVFQTVAILQSSSILFEFRSTIVRDVHTIEDIRQMIHQVSPVDTFILQRSLNANAMDNRIRTIPSFTDDEMNDFVNNLRVECPSLSWR
ncbi:MAG: anaerobic ribonucleoside-triphosphate reductase activating protein [Candidatus Woesearchaeota archaeon]